MVYSLKNIDTVIFTEGGNFGYTYLGVHKYLDEIDVWNQVKIIVGISAGAMASIVLYLGFKLEDLVPICKNEIMFSMIGLDLENIFSITETYGLIDGRGIKSVLKVLFRRRGLSENCTFRELKNIFNKDIYLLATEIPSGNPKLFSYIETPNIKVIDAVLASMALPLFIQPVEINGIKYIDGGLSTHKLKEELERQCNISNPIVFKFIRNQNNPESLFSYIRLVMFLIGDSSNKFDKMEDDNWNLCNILIDSFDNIEPLDLIKIGYKRCKQYFKNNKFVFKERKVVRRKSI